MALKVSSVRNRCNLYAEIAFVSLPTMEYFITQNVTQRYSCYYFLTDMEQDVAVMERIQNGERIFETEKDLQQMAELLGMPGL